MKEYKFVKFERKRRRNAEEVKQLKLLAEKLGYSYETLRHPSYKHLLTNSQE